MQRFISLLLLVASATASAEVFRRVGPDGEVYFSDTPTPGSQRVDLGDVQSVPLRSIPQGSSAIVQPTGDALANESAPPYAQFEIIKPSNGQGVRANDGSVTVYLSLQPALRSGDTIVLIVDGEDGASIRSGDTLNFNLSNMSRGQHSLAARVQNAKGEGLIETGPVSFYVLRAALGG